MFIAPSEMCYSPVASSCMQWIRPLTELCTPLATVAKYPIKKLGGALNFKGLSHDGGRADFSKNIRTFLFNKYLNTYQKKNEPNFRRFHLAEHYLQCWKLLDYMICSRHGLNYLEQYIEKLFIKHNLTLVSNHKV